MNDFDFVIRNPQEEDAEQIICCLTFEITFADNRVNESVKDALTAALIVRSREIKAQYPDKRIVTANYIDTDKLKDLSFYLARGLLSIIRLWCLNLIWRFLAIHYGRNTASPGVSSAQHLIT